MPESNEHSGGTWPEHSPADLPEGINKDALGEFLYTTLPFEEAEYWSNRLLEGLAKEAATTVSGLSRGHANRLERNFSTMLQKFLQPAEDILEVEDISEADPTDIATVTVYSNEPDDVVYQEDSSLAPLSVTDSAQSTMQLPELDVPSIIESANAFLDRLLEHGRFPGPAQATVIMGIVRRGLHLQQVEQPSIIELSEIALASRATEVFTRLHKGLAIWSLKNMGLETSAYNFEIAMNHLYTASLLFLSQPHTKSFADIAKPMIKRGIEEAIANHQLTAIDTEAYLAKLNTRRKKRLSPNEEGVLARLISADYTQGPQIVTIANRAVETFTLANSRLLKYIINKLHMEDDELVYATGLSRLRELIQGFAQQWPSDTKFSNYAAPQLENYLRDAFEELSEQVSPDEVPATSPPIINRPPKRSPEHLYQYGVVPAELYGLLATQPPTEAAQFIRHWGEQLNFEAKYIDITISHVVDGRSYREITAAEDKTPIPSTIQNTRSIVSNVVAAICKQVPESDVSSIRAAWADKLGYIPKLADFRQALISLDDPERQSLITQLVRQAGGAVKYAAYEQLREYPNIQGPAENAQYHQQHSQIRDALLHLTKVLSNQQATQLGLPVNNS